jgi:hypothetical protein
VIGGIAAVSHFRFDVRNRENGSAAQMSQPALDR